MWEVSYQLDHIYSQQQLWLNLILVMTHGEQIREVKVWDWNVSAASATNMTFKQTSVLLLSSPAEPKIFILNTVIPCKSAKEKKKKQFPPVSENPVHCTARHRPPSKLIWASKLVKEVQSLQKTAASLHCRAVSVLPDRSCAPSSHTKFVLNPSAPTSKSCFLKSICLCMLSATNSPAES